MLYTKKNMANLSYALIKYLPSLCADSFNCKVGVSQYNDYFSLGGGCVQLAILRSF